MALKFKQNQVIFGYAIQKSLLMSQKQSICQLMCRNTVMERKLILRQILSISPMHYFFMIVVYKHYRLRSIGSLYAFNMLLSKCQPDFVLWISLRNDSTQLESNYLTWVKTWLESTWVDSTQTSTLVVYQRILDIAAMI